MAQSKWPAVDLIETLEDHLPKDLILKIVLPLVLNYEHAIVNNIGLLSICSDPYEKTKLLKEFEVVLPHVDLKGPGIQTLNGERLGVSDGDLLTLPPAACSGLRASLARCAARSLKYKNEMIFLFLCEDPSEPHLLQNCAAIL